MKTTTTKFILALTAFLFILFNTSCQKGDTGTPGQNGTGNIASRTYTVNTWAYTSPNHYVNLSVPELTNANINSCAVMVYFSTPNSDSWRAVPFTQYGSLNNYYMNFNSSIGNVQVTWFSNSSIGIGSNPNDYYSATSQFKVVVIAAALKAKNADINYQNYSEVKAKFGLKD